MPTFRRFINRRLKWEKIMAGVQAAIEYISSVAGGTTKNNFDGWIGMKITVGGSPIILQYLTRRAVSGNSGTHNMAIIRGDGAAVLATTSVNMSGVSAGTFAKGAISYTLAAGTTYYILSQETNGGDQWIDNDSSVTTTAVATLNNSAFATSGDGTGPTDATASTDYGPVSFEY